MSVPSMQKHFRAVTAEENRSDDPFERLFTEQTPYWGIEYESESEELEIRENYTTSMVALKYGTYEVIGMRLVHRSAIAE